MRIIRSLVTYLVMISVLVFAASANAITFGDIKTYSYLDEPLNAEIELTGLNGLDPDQLIVSLASANDFVRANLERPFFLTTLTFSVFTYQDRVFASVKSSKVVKSPYLELLISFEWPTGSFIKDYTILLDPPPKNLNSATRPVPYSTLADKQTSQKLFPNDIKELQKNKTAQQTATETQPRAPVVLSAPSNPAVPSNAAAPSAATPTAVTTANAATTPSTVAVTNNAPQMPQQATAAQQAAVASNTPPVKTQFQKQVDQHAQRQANAHETMLDATIDDIKDLDAMVTNSHTDLQHLAAERQKHLDMYKNINDMNNEPEIDFGDVIKPNGAAATLPGSVPGAPTAIKPLVAPQPPQTSGALQLLLTGFLLGAVVVVGIGLKKGWHKKLLSRSPEPLETIIPNANIFDDDFDFEKDTDFQDAMKGSRQTEVHEIEITGLPKTASDHLNLDEFERELVNLSAEHSTNNNEQAQKAPSKTMGDLLNISDLIKPEAAAVKAPPPQPVAPPQPAAPVKVVPEQPPVVPPAALTLETTTQAADSEPEFNFADVAEEIAKDTASKRDTADLTKDVIDDLQLIDLQTTAPTPKPAATPAATAPTELLNTTAQKIELRLVDDIATGKSSTTKPSPEDLLHLEPEGAELITPAAEAVKLKIELAKKYLDAGDKDTARGLLNEVLQVAKDGQKLEAEIILSGIL